MVMRVVQAMVMRVLCLALAALVRGNGPDSAGSYAAGSRSAPVDVIYDPAKTQLGLELHRSTGVVMGVSRAGAAARAGVLLHSKISAVNGIPMPPSEAMRAMLEATTRARAQMVSAAIEKRRLSLQLSFVPQSSKRWAFFRVSADGAGGVMPALGMQLAQGVVVSVAAGGAAAGAGVVPGDVQRP